MWCYDHGLLWILKILNCLELTLHRLKKRIRNFFEWTHKIFILFWIMKPYSKQYFITILSQLNISISSFSEMIDSTYTFKYSTISDTFLSYPKQTIYSHHESLCEKGLCQKNGLQSSSGNQKFNKYMIHITNLKT